MSCSNTFPSARALSCALLLLFLSMSVCAVDTRSWPVHVIDQAESRSPQAADVDGDGDLDVISAGLGTSAVSWYENQDGAGHFSGRRTIDPAGPGGYPVGADLDGDGDIDVLTSATFAGAAWYENTDGLGTFGFRRLIDPAKGWVIPADLNNDGRLDLLMGSSARDDLTWRRSIDADGGLSDAMLIDVGSFASGAVADLNNDGHLDAVVGGVGTGPISWYRNTESGFGDASPISQSDGAAQIVTEDLDGDGDIDVLAASRDQDRVSWFENDGVGGFAHHLVAAHVNHVTGIYAVDIDADGDVDVFSTIHLEDTIAWFENLDGLGTFGDPQLITTQANDVSKVSLADLDGDGDPDVLAGFGRTLVWYENDDGDGDGVPDEEDQFPLDRSEAVDTDGDGRGDNSDPDRDNDGFLNDADAFPLDSSEWVDTDGDGVGDQRDEDDDDDSVPDQLDAFPLDATESVDTDGDGVGNASDADDDGDGVSDLLDAAPLDPTVALVSTEKVFALIETSLGRIEIELFPDIAPATVANFIRHGERSNYDASFFHRSEPEGRLYTGRFKLGADEGSTPVSAAPLPDESPFPNEAGAANQRGTVAAFQPDGPDSATSEWVINVDSFPTEAGGSHVVFGAVASGMEVVDEIAALRTWDLGGEFSQTPLSDYGGIYDSELLVTIQSVTFFKVLDTDSDGLSDEDEDIEGTDPEHPDSDNDGVVDGDDVFPLDGLEWADSDGDGVGDNEDLDDDGDGWGDYYHVSLGQDHGCVSHDDGVTCWGKLSSQLDLMPRQISSGNSGSCAIDESGVNCWGFPAALPDTLLDPSDVSIGAANTCVLDASGVNCWGDNRDGVNDVPPLDAATRVAVPGSTTTFACAIDDGRVVCWGANHAPLVGRLIPFSLTESASLAAGHNFVCSLDHERVRCSGFEQLDGIEFDHPRDLSSGHEHVCVLDNSGVQCFGSAGSDAPSGLIGIRKIGAGHEFSCALGDAGLTCWGSDFLGKVTSAPVDVTFTQVDSDLDGLLNGADADDDGDGALDLEDAFPLDASEQADTDSDGVGNNADEDDDGDGLPDWWETRFGLDPSSPADAGQDDDGDGLLNLREFELGYDPLNPNDFQGNPLVLNGCAELTEQRTLQLTPSSFVDCVDDQDGQTGSAFLESDFEVRRYTALSMSFSFRLHGLDAAGGGEGFAVVVHNDPEGAAAIGEGGSGLGYGGTQNSFAVEFTTRTFAPGTSRVAMTRQGGSVLLYESEVAFDLNDGELYTAQIEYRGLSEAVTLHLTNSSGVTATRSHSVDLTEIVGERAFVGMSAATSLYKNVHDIESLSLTFGPDPDWLLQDDDRDGLPNQAELLLGADPFNPDSDGDELPDGADLLPLDPNDGRDSDADGVTDLNDEDDDNDGVRDEDDAFPLDLSEWLDTDGDGIGDETDPDIDGDGLDATEEAGFRTSPILADTDGDRLTDLEELELGSDPLMIDTDQDGVSDALDLFPVDASESNDQDADGIGDNQDPDDDNDGLSDERELFLGTSAVNPDTDGDGMSDGWEFDQQFDPLDADDASLDLDDDGLINVQEFEAGTDPRDPDTDDDEFDDAQDAFPLDASEWIDTDADGVGDNADQDDDADGVPDAIDAYPLISLDGRADADTDGLPNECDQSCLDAGMEADDDDDNDGAPDAIDAFPLDATETTDTDGDGFGDNSDADDDGDGVLDLADAFPLDPSESTDSDEDGLGNNADPDDDGDGVPDEMDAFPLDATETIDTDSDGVGNNADTDDDDDGVLDSDDAYPLDPTESADTDGDGTGNNADPDDDNDGTLDVSDPAPTDPSIPARLINISTRGQVLTEDRVMIGGVIIEGTGPKTVVVRARGPSLVEFGVPNVLEDPFLQLFAGSTEIAVNDSWESGDRSDEIPLPLVPTSLQEAAILTTLEPGPYTVIVSGVGGETGVGIVEIFEIDTGESLLSNISTRGFVGLGDDVLIGGVIISGDAPKTVSIRARGPSLEDFGVEPVLDDPVLEIFSLEGQMIDSNDDWQSHESAAELPEVLTPSRRSEAAITVSLDPGAYTAIVRGKGSATGVGIVEVFAVD